MRSTVTSILVVVTLIVCVGAAAPAQQATPLPLAYYAYPLSGVLDDYGPQSQGYQWYVRKVFADVIDFFAYAPTGVADHPLLNPEIGSFLSLFHSARVWRALSKLANPPTEAAGIRVIKLYASSWIIQSPTTSIAIDFSQGPFTNTPITPFLTEVSPQQINALANGLDAYFVSHSHIDHISPMLVEAMLQRGKLVVMPAEIRDQAIASGYALAENVVCPETEDVIQYGDLEFAVFLGGQYWVWLDEAQTIPDPNHAFNVDNNAYFFRLNGCVVAHFGDNNDVGIFDFVQDRLADGWDVDCALNLGALAPALAPILDADLRFLTHDLEFTHIGPGFLNLDVALSGPNPNRRVLLWGECLQVGGN